MNQYRFLILIIFAYSLNLFAGEDESKELSYRVEAFGSLSTGKHTPFWIVSHTWGMVPLDANNGYLRGGIFYNQHITKDWNYSLGLDVAVSTPQTSRNAAWVQQLYGELNWKQFLRLNIGTKEDYTSLLDKNLSTGDMDFSQNTRPAPEIKISIPSFLAIPGTKDFLYFKGDMSVGWFMDGDYHEGTAKPYGKDYMTRILSQHKSLYFRIGNIEKAQPFQFIFGLDHQAQWAGYYYQNGMEYNIANGDLWNDFIDTFFAKEGGSNSILTDALYASGSSIGNYLLKLDYRAKDKSILSIYLSHFFEDDSGMKWQNAKDMLLGIQYKSPKKGALLTGALLEYMYMRDQSGPIHFNIAMDESHQSLSKYGFGMDDYYNNAIYVQGQSYFGRTRGNPLFLGPEYNTNGYQGFMSNRILAFHGGIEGSFSPDIEYRALLTYAETLGRYNIPYTEKKKGVSGVIDLTYHLPKVEGLDLKFSIGSDYGKYFDDHNFGFAFTVRKKGILLK